jgi:hypothetical protein
MMLLIILNNNLSIIVLILSNLYMWKLLGSQFWFEYHLVLLFPQVFLRKEK